ncbi:glycosyltransferase [Mobiluncus porci]|uniref:Glycosyltransferase family 2 protein n=1 Tax=Mobiluncus porci TaxID=2652278 RepID=A0A7K0K3L3_9ACTO|nr:glycosyltransferase family 2 protein [Mobiluncus porci]
MPLTVTALVVTSGETPYLAATLLAVSRQTLRPKEVFVIDVSRSGVAHRQGTEVLTAPGASNLGAALEIARQSPDFPRLESEAAVWLLHDDSAPAPTCLEEQVKVYSASENTKVVGAKQRVWDKAAQLLEVGIRATGTGRRLQEMDAGEIDQGQYDNRTDVLGVGTAAMLLDWDTYLELEGFNPALGPFGDGLEFSRRVHLAGYRVQVAPKAVVYHKLAGYYGLRGPDGGRPTRASRLAGGAGSTRGSVGAREALRPEPKRSFAARRISQLHNWMVAAPWWQFILLPAVVILLGAIRVLWRIVTKEPKLAGAEIKATLVTVFQPLSVWKARRKRLRHQKVPTRTLKPLQIKGSRIWQAKATQRKIAKDQRKPLIRDHTARINYAAEKNLDLALASSIALVLGGISVLTARFAISGVMGGAIPSLPAAGSTFWHTLVSGWLPSGLGYGSQILAADPLGLLLGILSQATGALGLKAPLVLSVLGFLTLPLAWLTAWWASGALTSSRPLRATVALSWALSPNLLASLGAGQVPVWILAWTIPLFAGSLARACGKDQTRTVLGDGNEPVTITIHSAPIIQTGVAALTGFIAVAANQILIVPLLVLLALGLIKGFAVTAPENEDSHRDASNFDSTGLSRKTRLTIRHALIIVAPSLWLVLPNLIRTLGHPTQWPLWISTLGVPQNGTPPNWWDLLTGWPLAMRTMQLPLHIPAWQWLAILPVTLTLLLVLASIVLPSRQTAPHLAGFVALLGLAIAWLSSVTPVAIAQGTPVTAWAGPGLAVYHASLLVAAVMFLTRFQVENPFEIASWSEKTLHALLAVAVLIPVVGVAPGIASEIVAPTKSSFQQTRAFSEEMLPATIANGQAGTKQWRGLNLSVRPAPNQSTLVDATLWRGWRDTVYEASPWVKMKNYQNVAGTRSPDAADAALARAVAALLGGSTPDLTEQLASLNVNYVVVENTKDGSTTSLINALDSAEGLERVTKTKAGTVWRLADEAVPAGLLRVAEAKWSGGRPNWPTRDARAIALDISPAGRAKLPAGDAGRLLAISERLDPSFTIRVGGKPLEVVENGQWNGLYKLPAGEGELTVSHAYLPHQLWGGVLLGFLFIAFAAALPLRRVSEVSL